MPAPRSIHRAVQPFRRKVPPYGACTTCSRIQPFSSTRSVQRHRTSGIQNQLKRDPIQFRRPGNASPAGTLSKLKTLTREELPDDLGLVHETFIKPVRSKRPSWFQRPKKRFGLEWYWLKNRMQGIGATIVHCKYSKPAPRIPLGYAERRATAVQLHQDFYSAIAEGDRAFIRENCCPNLAKRLLNEISNRPATQQRAWKLTSYRGLNIPQFLARLPLITWLTPFTSVRVVSDRPVVLPFGNACAMRQVVVRISSNQELSTTNYSSTTRGDMNAYQLEGSTTTKKFSGTEYFVIQKLRHEGDEDKKWKIWGTIQPEEDFEEYKKKIDKMKEKDYRGNVLETVKDMMPGMGGNGML